MTRVKGFGPLSLDSRQIWCDLIRENKANWVVLVLMRALSDNNHLMRAKSDLKTTTTTIEPSN